MKKLLMKIIIAVLIVTAIVSIILYDRYTSEIDLTDKTVTIIIKPGDSLNKVCDRLVEEKVVKSKLMLKIPGRLFGVDKKLTPGRYDFTGVNSCQSILNRLETADFLRIKVTIPEGNTIWETAALLASKLELDSATIHNFNNDSIFLEEINLKSLEGYLYPETYFFKWGIDEKEALTQIVDMFLSQTEPVLAHIGDSRYSAYEILTLASIIESETGLKDERRMVSSVYHNRLNRKMKLDADPTVIYGMGGLERKLYRKDLQKDSPYNTYLRKGLTPTPINSPGLEAIKAALNPEETDFLYFVADDSGGHVFSRTLTEHNRAIRKIKAEK